MGDQLRQIWVINTAAHEVPPEKNISHGKSRGVVRSISTREQECESYPGQPTKTRDSSGRMPRRFPWSYSVGGQPDRRQGTCAALPRFSWQKATPIIGVQLRLLVDDELQVAQTVV